MLQGLVSYYKARKMYDNCLVLKHDLGALFIYGDNGSDWIYMRFWLKRPATYKEYRQLYDMMKAYPARGKQVSFCFEKLEFAKDF